MNFGETLRNGCFCLDLAADNKQGIIEEMLELLVQSGKVRDRAKALACVLERENKMSTGMSDGVAVPHGKTDAVDELATVFAMKRGGTDFQSFDGKPSRIFIMTLSPLNRTGPHMQYLGEISKLLKQAPIRDRLLGVSAKEEIVRILTSLSE